MTFRLANIDDRSALVDDNGNYFDLATISGDPGDADPMTAIGKWPQLHDLSANLGAWKPTGQLTDVELGPPVPRPRNSFAIGLNYQSHVNEASMEPPEVPLVFTKFPSCIVGPTAAVELRSHSADYEAELVVVIGTGGRDIAATSAWDHVAGVTVGQDISDRQLQFSAKPPHFDLGKSRDTYGPIGPLLVSPDSLDNRDALSLTCEINGEPRQAASTAQLIFDVPTLIAYISGIATLAPGDIIFTGTPEGVGFVDGKFLSPGDVITTTVDGIGTLTNTCI